MINLAIDLGNTRIKFGVFECDVLRFSWKGTIDESYTKLEELLKLYDFDQTVICATGNSKDFVTFVEKKGLSFEVVSSQTPMPFNNAYTTPHTLGVDRMVLVAGAQKEYPEEPVLIIDAGTCLTYDFKDANGTYQGGAISPGLQMRFKAMHEFTARLPYLEIADTEINVIGKSTNEAMQSGVVNGMVAEIDGLIDWYKGKFEGLKIILTGGDGQFLSGRLKNGIFANSNFLLTGLNYIIVFNRN